MRTPQRTIFTFPFLLFLLYRAENRRFSTLRCTKTGGTQPKLGAACFVVQSCLADADFVVFTRQIPAHFSFFNFFKFILAYSATADIANPPANPQKLSPAEYPSQGPLAPDHRYTHIPRKHTFPFCILLSYFIIRSPTVSLNEQSLSAKHTTTSLTASWNPEKRQWPHMADNNIFFHLIDIKMLLGIIQRCHRMPESMPDSAPLSDYANHTNKNHAALRRESGSVSETSSEDAY